MKNLDINKILSEKKKRIDNNNNSIRLLETNEYVKEYKRLLKKKELLLCEYSYYLKFLEEKKNMSR